jgi:DNA segregation ATPase FtsK/SpoIIIE, S-DNA-T family
MLELQLRVELDDGRTHDVVAELAEEHRVTDLATAVARHIGMSVPTGHDPKVRCARLGAQLDGEVPVIDSGLLSGDLVQLSLAYVDPGLITTSAGGGLFCDVVSGPSSGISLPLRAGRVTVGRDPACDLTLEDPTVSKRHAELVIDSCGNVEVAPTEDITNPVVIDGQPIEALTSLPLGSVLELGSCALVVRHYEPERGEERDQLGQIPFNRTPYRHPDLTPVEVRGPGKPPGPYEPRPLMVLAMLAPAVAGVAFAFILQRPIFLLFALLSPISMLGSWISERRRGGTTHKQQVATFERRLEAWEQRYDEALAEERRRRLLAAPDVAELARRAELRTAELWARSRRTLGFLELRLGLGDALATTTTPLPQGVDEDPDQRIEKVIEARSTLPSIPITVDLPDRGVLAIHGSPREVETSVSSLLIQAAILHSPDDLIVCAYLHPRRTLTDWVKWLPHTRSVVSPLEGPHLATGQEEANDLLRRLVAVIGTREEDDWPRILVVLDELADADSLLVSTVLESGPQVGVHAVWIGQDRAMVPRHATTIMDCPPIESGERAGLWSTDPTEPPLELTPDRLSLEAAPRLARAIAPVRDASSASAAASIPRVAPLLETIGSPTLDRQQVAARWSRPVEYGLDAPIGIGPAGPLMIDMVEHGPHALIAGTSGAGKSELLQSAIAALIANHPPTRLNLLFIDYKGGASSNIFQAVPHTVGYVTNLGADLAMRALVSLRAELDRRMRVMEGRAKDLEEMLEKHPDEAPPSLVIVVDEFATLVKEIPDFVTGMVDIAQRGRSLGIHLILATQRPAGAVNDNILANTNLRISLRVLDPADSSSILGSAEAASIPAPLRGRGFARLGAGGLIEFQSAFSGAPYTASGGVTPIVVTRFPPDGEVTVHPEPAEQPTTDDQRTHLEVLLDAVVGATEDLGHQRGRRPWLEDLPQLIDVEDILAGDFGPVPERVPGRDLLLGVVDLPREQAQRPEVLDVEAAGGLLIFGTAGSGRTTTLRTMIASAIDDATPEEVEVYVLDFAGRGLEPLRDLPHVAGVAAGDDLEQATRMLMHLHAEVTRRQELLADERAENLTALNQQRPDDPVSRLILVLDGYEAFDRSFERGDLYTWAELLVETVLSGRAVGLHLIASADRRIGVPAALSNSMSGRIILRTADSDGLVDLGIPTDIARDARLGDGRALLPGGTALQVALVGDDVGNKAQTAALEERSQRAAKGKEIRLPELPDVLHASDLPAGSEDPLAFPLGVADLTGDTVTCDVRLQHLSVIGPGESGRSTALRRGATDLAARGHDVWVITEPASPLAALDLPEGRLVTSRDAHAGLLEQLAQSADSADMPQVLIVDRAEQVNDAAAMTLERLANHERVRILAGFEGATMSSFSQPPWMAPFKRTRRMLLLQPDDLGDLGTFTSLRIRLRPGQAFPPGRGVFIAGRAWHLVQVAQDG